MILNKVCDITFGSHLYGTATPTSDRDVKGIFIPTIKEMFLGRIPKTSNSSPKDDTRKNLSNELDAQYYSIHHFLKLATQGQTVAIDMLFAPNRCVRRTDRFGWVWDRIVANRQKLLSKQMNAFVGYARAQAAKYSLKGERLEKLRNFREALAAANPEQPLWMYWDKLPKDDERKNPQGIRELQIGGKWFGETTYPTHILASIDHAIARYGRRANDASQTNSVDWKALSHAVRVACELEDIFQYGSIAFPLPYANKLLEIKQGKWKLEDVQDQLDRTMRDIEDLVAISNLPDEVDMKFWDDLLVQIMIEHISNENATTY